MGPDHCDIVVVGGGIHGVGIAQAAAAEGHRVLLLEKETLAAGTSSRSSKLIHGGLRYLESGHLGLVRESLRERRLLLANAPELVQMQHFFLPVYKATRRKDWQLITGLSLYAVLSGFGRGSAFRRLGPAAADRLDGLKTKDLKAIYRYSDASTDDLELTRAVAASAVSMGARLRLHAKFVGAQLEKNGCAVRYQQAGREREVFCRILVNAAGPWADRVLALISPGQKRVPMALVQGSHLVIPSCPVENRYYIENPRDGRGIFVLPWYGGTMVGTTEARFKGDPDTVAPTSAEIRYLWSALIRHFPHYADIDRSSLTAFAGLRVLPGGRGHAFHLSRETRLIADRRFHPRILTIYGGKLTAYRATAEKVVKSIAGSLATRRTVADTRRVRLDPAPADWPGESLICS
jgi:glycerol-3-phosphate dehydrogenase